MAQPSTALVHAPPCLPFLVWSSSIRGNTLVWHQIVLARQTTVSYLMFLVHHFWMSSYYVPVQFCLVSLYFAVFKTYLMSYLYHLLMLYAIEIHMILVHLTEILQFSKWKLLNLLTSRNLSNFFHSAVTSGRHSVFQLYKKIDIFRAYVKELMLNSYQPLMSLFIMQAIDAICF